LKIVRVAKEISKTAGRIGLPLSTLTVKNRDGKKHGSSQQLIKKSGGMPSIAGPP
jgi:hypothetical protein